MKRARRVALGVLVVLLTGVCIAYGLARSSSPTVPLEGDPESEDEAALRELFHDIGDPRELEDGELVTVRLGAAQVAALAAEASRRRQRVSARVRLVHGKLDVILSAESPWRWLTPYVNVSATLSGPPNAPVVERAVLGSLPVPASIGQALFDHGYAEVQARDPVVAAAIRAVEDVTYADDSITVRVHWTDALRHQLRQAGREVIADELGGERLAPYFEVLRRTLEAGAGETRELVELMPPVFAAVRARVAEGREARPELDAAIVVLTLYSLGLPLDDALGELAPPPLPQHVVQIHGRSDLPKHFLVSAVTTLLADRAVADALGLAKELRDSEDANGSGFSFADLAADRAGARLMERAVTSPSRIAALIDRLARPLADADLVPVVEDLPEGMDAEAFRRTYEDVDGPAYRALVARIDARTDECAVHRAVEAAR